MRIVGAEAVDEADGVLVVGPRDRVTPLARDRAYERGVEIRVEEGSASPSPSRDQGRRPSFADAPRSSGSSPQPKRAGTAPAAMNVTQAPPREVPTTAVTYRRGAPAVRGDLRHSSPPRVRRAVVVGCGQVGTTTATHLARSDLLDEVVVVDVVDGLAAGTALDLWHAASLLGFSTAVRGETRVTDAGEADLAVITAGRARQPGMTRADLAATNAEIVGAVAADLAQTSPNAVTLVVTNPLDEMTDYAWRTSGFPPERVIGMAGLLDTARFRSLLALEAGVGRPDEVEAIALGSHGEEMVLPLSQAKVRGRAVTDLIEGPRLTDIVERVRGSGGEVVGLLKSGSAYLAPGVATAQMALAIAGDRRTLVPCSVKPNGAYDLPDVHVGLPARLGATGVQEVVELPLTSQERSELQGAAAAIEGRLLAASR